MRSFLLHKFHFSAITDDLLQKMPAVFGVLDSVANLSLWSLPRPFEPLNRVGNRHGGFLQNPPGLFIFCAVIGLQPGEIGIFKNVVYDGGKGLSGVSSPPAGVAYAILDLGSPAVLVHPAKGDLPDAAAAELSYSTIFGN